MTAVDWLHISSPFDSLPLFRYYRAVYERNIAFLQGNAEKKTQANLMNVAMELRKVCNVSHPSQRRRQHPEAGGLMITP